MRAFTGLLVFVVAVALAGPAAAHLALLSPTSRYGDSVLKEGPCGIAGGTRSANVTQLEPGARVVVVWDEYVNHPGHFRIAFDDDGDDDFVNPACLNGCDTPSPTIEMYSNHTVLLDGIADTPYGGQSSVTITLPDVECERCTLQVIQVMYDKPPYVVPGDDIYYQCADLVLRRAAPVATATATETQTPTPTATIVALTPTESATPASTVSVPRRCAGDCDMSDRVLVDELVTGVNIALGSASLADCVAFDVNGDGDVTVEELVDAVNEALNGCEAESR